MVKLRRVSFHAMITKSGESKGYFHKWVFSGLHNRLYAVVELEDGRIELMGYQYIKFDHPLNENIA